MSPTSLSLRGIIFYNRSKIDYDNSYCFKLFCFNFVNSFSWPFYLAFIKDNLAGVPPEYKKIFGYKWLGCGVSGCNYEITIQMFIVFIIKPILTNVILYFLPKMKIWLNKKKKYSEDWNISQEKLDESGELYVRRKKRWENEKDLLPENKLSFDYIEMVIQEIDFQVIT